MTTAATRTDWLGKSRSLAPLIAQHRDEGERDRRLPPPLFDAAGAAGFWHMLLPRDLGGDQAALADALAVAEEFGRQDGSTGWTITLGFASGLFSDYLPAAAARSIFGSQDAVLAGSFAPRGRAIRVAGGYRLSGRWSFMSGCQHSNWFFGGAAVENIASAPVAAVAPAARILIFAAAEGEIIDTWRTTGMRATGSHDVAVTDVFVPDAHTFPHEGIARGPTPRPGQGYPRPFHEIAPLLLAAVGLGIARNAVESFVALAAEKTPSGMATKLATQATVHERIGRSEALLRAARTYLYTTAGEVTAASTETPPMVLPARLAAAHAAQTSVDVVTLLYQAAGGTSIYETSPLERCFRDVNTLTHHAMIAPGTFVAAGEWLLAPVSVSQTVKP
jgi:alkylation response protein AidB-like acyl-CoA dehydrogenase